MRFNAKIAELQRTGIDGLRIVDPRGQQQSGRRRVDGRIEQTAPGIDKISGHQRLAIGPLQLGAQEKSPLQPIVTHLPALCLSRDDMPLPIIADQPFKQIDQYRLPRKTGAHQCRIQRLRLGTVALD